jgi:hypothetical protein
VAKRWPVVGREGARAISSGGTQIARAGRRAWPPCGTRLEADPETAKGRLTSRPQVRSPVKMDARSLVWSEEWSRPGGALTA